MYSNRARLKQLLLTFDSHYLPTTEALGKGRTRPIWVMLAHSGDSLIIFPLLGFFWFRQDLILESWPPVLAGAIVLSMALTLVLKLGFRRTRPGGDWGKLYRKTDPHSFPSGHAARCSGVAGALLSLGMVLPGVLAVGWALGVGTARAALGIHYPSDVLVGWILGLCCGLITGVIL